MHIKFKNLCNASKHMNMHISNATNQSSWACSPLLVCFSCPRILILLHSSMLLSLCLCPTSTSPPWCIFISLHNLSPFAINFHKWCASYWCKGLHWDRWLTLESCIFYGHPHICWNDTTCSPWDISCRIFDLDTNKGGTSPYVIAWVIHLIYLSSCMWGNLLHLMIT